jgi:hypothetical protein
MPRGLRRPTEREERGVYRGAYSTMVDDPHQYQILTPNARLVLLTIRLCKEAGPACIFRYYPEVLQAQTGLAGLELGAALEELARLPSRDRPWVMHDDRAKVIWIRNGLRFDPGIALANPRQFAGIWRSVQALPPTPLAASFCRYYKITKAFVKAQAEALRRLRHAGDAPTRARSDSDSDSEIRVPRQETTPPPTSPPAPATGSEPGRSRDGNGTEGESLREIAERLRRAKGYGPTPEPVGPTTLGVMAALAGQEGSA